jgi:hypothetical protein
MSNALAIASVTAVLTNLLENMLTVNAVSGMSDTTPLVTALAPDLIKTDSAVQLNLFLYHVEMNNGWRNIGQPSRDGRGARITNPPLALDLSYLLTAYGKVSYEAEILLGFAMQLLHEWPVLTREEIRKVIGAIGAGDPTSLKALKKSNLADQVEQIKITQRAISAEEASKLWTATQSHYRPSAAYHVSVVLIESEYPGSSPLPVLTRGPQDSGVVVQPDLTPPYPTLLSVEPPRKQLSTRLGEALKLKGFHLDAGTLPGDGVKVLVTNARLPADFELTPTVSTATDIEVKLEKIVGTDPQNWVAGIYTISAIVTKNGKQRTTNELPFTLAPRINSIVSVTRDANNIVTVVIECVPDVRPVQRTTLVIGSREVQSEPHPAQTKNLTFIVGNLAPQTYYLRLRVDGAESLLIDRSVTPPVFIASTASEKTDVTVT